MPWIDKDFYEPESIPPKEYRRKPPAFDPSREDIELALAEYLANGGRITYVEIAPEEKVTFIGHFNEETHGPT